MSRIAHLGDTLTEGELKVLAGFADGFKLTEIAVALHYSPSTIRDYRKSARGKLGAPNTAAAVAMAIRRGLIP